MTTPSINNLAPKFQGFLIGSPTCPANIKIEIDGIFQQPLKRLKSNYIFDAGKWVLKLGRTDVPGMTPDTHMYRVRKAEKIRSYIEQNKLEDHIEVPKKYLYWNEKEKQFYVVAEKMNLSSEVGTPASEDFESRWKSVAHICGGQAQSLANNARKRSLTPTQAKALAELSILGYTDLTYNNLYFTLDGKVAILDTEPIKRPLKKMVKSSFFFFLFGDKGSMLSSQSLGGIAKLKSYIDTPEALQAVEKVERNHALWSIAQLITKIVVVTLAIYFVPTITALIPIPEVAMALKVSFIAVAVLKDLTLTLTVISVYRLWHLSYKGFEGLSEISRIEQIGGC